MNGRDFTSFITLAPGVALPAGQLGGYVFDPSGAVIPNAQVEVQNTVTHGTWSASTTAEGYWAVGGLTSGTYQITASALGFRVIRQTLHYDASNPKAYRTTLDVGSATDTIEVQASALELDTDMSRLDSKDKKHKAPPPPPPGASPNVFNLQQRVVGVLPIAVDVPRAGTSYRFLRPLVVNEETKLSFTYKSK